MSKRVIITLLTIIITIGATAQEPLTIRQCIDYALQNNLSLQKSRLDIEKAGWARKEITGSLLPQLSGQAGIQYNIQKQAFVMPNFLKEFMPESILGPNAADYMKITMAMNWGATAGANLTQQIVNFSLFNALDIASTATKMAELGVAASEEEVIAQTASLYYSIQVTNYAVEQFFRSEKLLETMLSMMENNLEIGLVKQVDVDRVKVALTNLTTQRQSLTTATKVQENLLKLQMNIEQNEPIAIVKIDMQAMEQLLIDTQTDSFDAQRLTALKIVGEKQQMATLQKRSAVYENLPMLSFGANYQLNMMSNEFFRGSTFYKLPMSMVGFNLRVPIIAGGSRRSKLNQAKVEIEKANIDYKQLMQSLTMNYRNSQLKLFDNIATIDKQRKNQQLAEEVFEMTENNYSLGLASLSDVLNASSSLIEAQVRYAEALGNGIKACIDLKKAGGKSDELRGSNIQ